MEKILRVHSVNDYARYIGAPELHPLVSVIHYDELEHCRHSLNNYDVYALFIGDEELEDLSYGQLQYDLHRHALMCVAPGQIGGKATSHIRRFLMQRAQQLLISGATITETSEQLGFDYPQHFTRQFKKHFGLTPSEFIRK